MKPLVYTIAQKSVSSQLREISKTASERVLPAPKTPAMHRSERPVRIARSNATATVRTCPSPCAANGSRLLRIYSSCGPGMATLMGVSKRQSTRTKASVSLVRRSLIILRTGMLGYKMPIVSGSRAGFAQFTSASCVTKESHFFHHNRKACKRQWALASLVRGQSIPLPLAVALGGKCKRNRLGDQD